MMKQDLKISLPVYKIGQYSYFVLRYIYGRGGEYDETRFKNQSSRV